MVELLEKLRKEWQVIKGAPFSFAIVCLLAIGAVWSGFQYVYKDKLADAEHRATNWKNDSDYWKDKANGCLSSPQQQKPQSNAEPQIKPTPKTKSPKEPSLGQTNVRPPIMKQDCGGGNCAQSSGQTGGITAGSLTVARMPLEMSDRQRDAVAAQLVAFGGESVAINVDRPTPETDKFANNLGAALSMAHIKYERSNGMFSGGCLASPGVSFMAGVNRMNLVRAIWQSLVDQGIVAKADTIPGCSRNGEPNEFAIFIRPN